MRTARTRITIESNGSIVVQNADTLNFLGSGFSGATDDGNGVASLTFTAGGAGGTAIYTESLTPTTSGANITLNLALLAHTFTSILFPTIDGKVLGQNNPGDGSSYWSRSGNTLTIFNAATGSDYLVTYTV